MALVAQINQAAKWHWDLLSASRTCRSGDSCYRTHQYWIKCSAIINIVKGVYIPLTGSAKFNRFPVAEYCSFGEGRINMSELCTWVRAVWKHNLIATFPSEGFHFPSVCPVHWKCLSTINTVALSLKARGIGTRPPERLSKLLGMGNGILRCLVFIHLNGRGRAKTKKPQLENFQMVWMKQIGTYFLFSTRVLIWGPLKSIWTFPLTSVGFALGWNTWMGREFHTQRSSGQ